MPKRIACRKCGTFISDQAIIAAEKHFTENGVTVNAASSVTIPVHFHVVSKDNTLAGGNIPYVHVRLLLVIFSHSQAPRRKSQITAQMLALNKAYGPWGLQWSLADSNITRTVNVDWFNKAGPNT
jgi:hypothetical protein